jgi:tetratricopeptide (TPR) repeat protein
MIEYYPQSIPYLWHYEIQLLAYAFARDTNKINKLCDQVLAEFGINPYRQLLYNATSHFKLLGESALFEIYLDKAYNEYLEYKSAYYGDLLVWRGQLKEGLEHFDLMLTRYPEDDRLLFRKANTLALMNEVDGAERIMRDWDDVKDPYDYGWTPYRKAVVYTSMGDTSKALINLRQAVIEGRWFRYNRYEFDPDLLGIMDSKEFDEIIHPLR